MVARIQKEQEDNMSEMDKAKELLKMKTVKIQRAAPQEVTRPFIWHSALKNQIVFISYYIPMSIAVQVLHINPKEILCQSKSYSS